MRTRFSSFALAAGLGLALAFTFGCSGDGGGGGNGGGDDVIVLSSSSALVSSSSSVVFSSSSLRPSSSSSVISSSSEVVQSSSSLLSSSSSFLPSSSSLVSSSSSSLATYTVTYDANGGSNAPVAQTKTGVELTLSLSKPTRTGYAFTGWNTKADGSGSYFDSGASYTANADLKLYAQWIEMETVVIGDQTWSKNNLNGKLYDYKTATTICPSGWHLPGIVEWTVLINYVECSQVCKNCAAKYLKTTTNWYGHSGLDSYGFSAQPDGLRGTIWIISPGEGGVWWTGGGGMLAMDYVSDSAYFVSYDSYFASTFSASVRCLQDDYVLPDDWYLQSCQRIVYGPSVNYEGETYETVVIGEQTWFKRNLNYNANGSKCYDNNTNNCTQYGRLYDWATAMALPSNCNHSSSCQIKQKHQGICPSGWHIPNDREWNTLIVAADGARKLKATSGWSVSGTDSYGFSALPGGWGGSDDNYHDVGNHSSWWSSSEILSNSAYQCYTEYDIDMNCWESHKEFLRSVRCLQD